MNHYSNIIIYQFQLMIYNDKVVYIIIYTPVQTTSHTWGRIPLGKWVIPQVRLKWTIPYYIWDEIWVMDYKPRILSGMHIHLCIYIYIYK